MNSEFDFLRRILMQISPLSDESIRPVFAHVQHSEFKAGEFPLRAGERATHVLIVVKGLLHEYLLDRDGRQATRNFSKEGGLSGSLGDLISGAPALSYIEALEPTSVLTIPWIEIDKAAQTDIKWQLLLRRVVEHLYVDKRKREYALLALSAGERLDLFKQDFSGLLSRIPKHAIASYLGITPVHLSRLSSENR
jgi:CRP-like cAMP-binding protein